MNTFFSDNCDIPDEYGNKNNKTFKDNLLDASASFNTNIENFTDFDDCCTSISQQPVNPLYFAKSPVQKISLPDQKLVEDERFWREISGPFTNLNQGSKQTSKKESSNNLNMQEDSIISSSSAGTFSANKDPKNRLPDAIESWTVNTDGTHLIISGFSKQCGTHVNKICQRRISNNIFFDADDISCSVVGNMIENRGLPMFIHYKFFTGIPDDWQEIIIAWNKYTNLNCPPDFKWPALKPITLSPRHATDSDFSSTKSNHKRKYTCLELSKKIKKMQKLLRLMKFQESLTNKTSNSRNESVLHLVNDLKVNTSSRNGLINRDSQHWTNQNPRFDITPSSSNVTDYENRFAVQNANPNRLFFNNYGFGVTSFHKKSSVDILNQADTHEKQNTLKPAEKIPDSSDFSFNLDSSDYIFSNVGTKAKENNVILSPVAQDKNKIVSPEETENKNKKKKNVDKKSISRKLDFDANNSTGSSSKKDSTGNKKVNSVQKSNIFIKPVTTKTNKKSQESNITKLSTNLKTQLNPNTSDISSIINRSQSGNIGRRELKNLDSSSFTQSVLSDTTNNSSSFVSSRGRRRVPPLQYWKGQRMTSYKEIVVIEQSTTIRQDLDNYIKTTNFDTLLVQNLATKIQNTSNLTDTINSSVKSSSVKKLLKNSIIETPVQQTSTKKQNATTKQVLKQLGNDSDGMKKIATRASIKKSNSKSSQNKNQLLKQLTQGTEVNSIVINTSVKKSSAKKLTKNENFQMTKDAEIDSKKRKISVRNSPVKKAISNKKHEITTSVKKSSSKKLTKNENFQLTNGAEIDSKKRKISVRNSPVKKVISNKKQNKTVDTETKLISKQSTIVKKRQSRKSTKKQLLEGEETKEDTEIRQLRSNSKKKNNLTPTPKKRKIDESSDKKQLNDIETSQRYSTRHRQEINYNEKKLMRCQIENIEKKLDESKIKSVLNKTKEKNKTKANEKTVVTPKINESENKIEILQPVIKLSPLEKDVKTNKNNKEEFKNLDVQNLKKVEINFKLPKPKKNQFTLPPDPREMSMLIKQTKRKNKKNSKPKAENHSTTILMSQSMHEKRKLFSERNWTSSDKFEELILQNITEPVRKPKFVIQVEKNHCPSDFEDKFSEVGGLFSS